MATEFGFDAGEAEAIVAALEPQIRRVAAKVWEQHPRNPINMTIEAIERELLSTGLKPERRALLEAEHGRNPHWITDPDERAERMREAIESDAAPCDGGPTPEEAR